MHTKIEWPTLALLAATYALWAVATTLLSGVFLPTAIALTAVAIAQHSSLQHEAIHGHPFENPLLNAALVAPALTLVIPYTRFRDTHLAHHRDSELTDPYDDPESNYLDGAVFERLPRPAQRLLTWNNTLVGRLILGPLIGTAMFVVRDLRALPHDQAVRRAWAWHIAATLPVVAWIALAPMPAWAYALSVYLGLSLLRIRTFLEHQAHAQARARSVIIEDRGPLALLFLNNNFHVVHHMHPRVPWYRLPALYDQNRQRYSRMNGGYVFGSYAEVFRRYLFRCKDPVAHPLWRRG